MSLVIEVQMYDHIDYDRKAAWFFESGQLWIATRAGELVGSLEVGARRVIKMLAVDPAARDGVASRQLLAAAQSHFAPAALAHDNNLSEAGERLMNEFGIQAEPGTAFERLSKEVAEKRAEESLIRAKQFLDHLLATESADPRPGSHASNGDA